MGYNVAVDVGGTFTDVLVFNEDSGHMTLAKVLSTPDNPAIGVINGVEQACKDLGIDFSALHLFIHGTTVVTNMILEGKGAKVGLITTGGHEQILHLARAWTPGPLYGWMQLNRPDPPADLADTIGVSERMSAAGTVVRPLFEDEIRSAVRHLVDRGVTALAIAFLNSYVNPDHETKAREVALDLYPHMAVSISSDMAKEYGEYERALTTVINTSVRPRLITYMKSMVDAFKEKGFSGTLSVVRSDGGSMSPSAAAERPVQILLSGPAGGVAGAAYLAQQMKVPNVLTIDIGGTSTDVSLCLDGKANVRRDLRLGYYQFKLPAIDVHSVGAGGGSIAHISLSGALLVGPQSAGANPGPACYGQGGKEPTVTDANVMLHRIPPGVLLGGHVSIDEKAAKQAIRALAKKLQLDDYKAAQAILDIVNENLYSALRVVSVEQGYDPRRFALVAFGGAGPLHANSLARLIGSWPVIIPTTPGVLSAFGFLASKIQNEFSQTYLKIAEDTPASTLQESLEALRNEAQTWLRGEGVPDSDQEFDFFVDCRYHRQNIQIPCSLSLAEIKEYVSILRSRFEEEHRKRYGFDLTLPLEMATLRVIGRGKSQGIAISESPTSNTSDPSAAFERQEDVYFKGCWMKTTLYSRARLRPGNLVEGPAVILQEDSTVIIEPGYTGKVDGFGNILIDQKEVGQ
jgi:N-methylhydantoinase A